ncbi:MAG: alpha-amylase family glycosyl hydrolase [Chloroflexi bacterium]|nr:alpha-amylase family glycosyl hydrolase [Chloroflexota bacterium]MCL5273437.1 alpha-amylase family glycosyl hydrolase [Chloroflexota bacterium]
MEFHIARSVRDRYQFDDALFGLTGNVIFANFHAARVFAQKLNQKRDLLSFPEKAVKAAHINAMGLIDEILHQVVALYRRQRNPQVVAQALTWLDGRLGQTAVDQALRIFADEFPTIAVYRQGMDVDAYLRGQTEGIPNRQVALEEMLMLWLSNLNPAFAPYLELFDDTRLEQDTAYAGVMNELRAFFDTQPRFGPDNQNLIDLLRAPALAHPHSLFDQLQYISTRWLPVLGQLGQLLYRVLTSMDFIKEESKTGFMGPGPSRVPTYSPDELAAMGMALGGWEYERYSADRDWMPRLVLIAKNTYVWLDQLAKKYQREITRLDQIPDEELDELARRGFTGLWLIGLWQRSPASQRIKQLTGNPDALPSAYSLYDYRIGADLGGEEASRNLRERAMRRGIRMASDMVPNHMGIDSPWVMEHPDWFLQVDHSPYPSYSFNGPDLSSDGRVSIHIEDHYYDRTDAAVVFRRVDRASGEARFIYHGNDGTSMPWNDTAQLNYLLPQVREAVIQTILHVARQFPIIRFDAAMTLARRHVERLWFPEPGSGGAIPSRAEHSMSREAFNAAMPQEFWREVVDRAAVEAPDTLLLAEAFWLMEGYFVRTLGMHRVYNSAFMNMLRDEENAKYRSLIKNTLEFDPQILKRYVGFMNNPDERTAVDQFGKGDKYFGICTLLSTLPGLPMFGHGQVEGFAEKYGMEFRRARWDEQPDQYLIERHEREIAPLLHKRYLFADVEHFQLYDFFTPDGSVNEEVYAYSNRCGDERALVIYHNKFADTRGWIRMSAAATVKTTDGGQTLAQTAVADGLGLRNGGDVFTIFRDHATGLEYLRNNAELHAQGIYVELNAYQSYVFTDFREVQDSAALYARLAAALNGRGVPSIHEALDQLLLQPIQQPFQELLNVGFLRWLIAAPDSPAVLDDMLNQSEQKLAALYGAARDYAHGDADVAAITRDLRAELSRLLQFPSAQPAILPLPTAPDNVTTPAGGEETGAPAVPAVQAIPAEQPADVLIRLPADAPSRATALIWTFVHALGKVSGADGYEQRSRSWIDEWQQGRTIVQTLQALGMNEPGASQQLALIKLLTTQQQWYAQHRNPNGLLEALLVDADAQQFLRINRYRDILWFNKESFDQMLDWLMLPARLGRGEVTPDTLLSLQADEHILYALRKAEGQSGYQVEKLLTALAVE